MSRFRSRVEALERKVLVMEDRPLFIVVQFVVSSELGRPVMEASCDGVVHRRRDDEGEGAFIDRVKAQTIARQPRWDANRALVVLTGNDLAL